MTPISTAAALQMMADALDEPLASVTPDRRRDSMAGWDSMGALALMAELDDRFGIQLTSDESLAMTKVGDMLGYLRERGALTD
jgi:acyl carrier protein